MSNPTLITDFEDVMTLVKNLQQKVKDLEDENKKLKIPDGVVRAFKGLVVNWWEDEEKYYIN